MYDTHFDTAAESFARLCAASLRWIYHIASRRNQIELPEQRSTLLHV